MSIANELIRDLEAEAKKTRAMLAVVPEAKLDWKPHAKSMTLGGLVGHVAENPAWIPAMLEDEMDFGAMKDYRPFAPKDRTELLTAFDKNMRAGLEAIRGRSDAFLLATWTMRNGDKVLMSAPKHEALRGTAIHHWIHHRGQLSVYLRLLDVPLPQTYGPTADSPSFG
ncbi:MAG: DinB family protein [Planctomycetes bacterium]|nr:DinB family protein [Planctomycetota bacterium]